MNKVRTLKELLDKLLNEAATTPYDGICRLMYELYHKNMDEYKIIADLIVDADPNHSKLKIEIPDKFKHIPYKDYYFPKGDWVIRIEYLEWLISNLDKLK